MPKILVMVKMVPDVSALRFDSLERRLVRSGVKSYMNPYDKKAVEEALRIREREGGVVSAVSMGPPQAEEVLREGLAMGCDGAYLLTDPAFAGSDTLATASALALACRKAGFDIVLAGRSSVDAETSQLVPEVAELLGASLVTAVRRMERVGEGRYAVEREDEGGTESFEVAVPFVASVSEKINKARAPTPEGKAAAARAGVTLWSADDLSQDASLFGAAGSPTVVRSLHDSSYERKPAIFRSADVEEAVSRVRALLSSKERQVPPAPAGSAGGRQGWSVFVEGEAETRTALEVLGRLGSLGMHPVAVIVAGSLDGRVAKLAFEAGAADVLHVQLEADSSWSSAARAAAVSEAIAAKEPAAVFFPSTVRGREVAGRVAARLRLGLTGDAVDLLVGGGGELVQVKPAFGGNIMAEIVSRTEPQMATVRPGVFPLAGNASDVGKVSTYAPSARQSEGLRHLGRTDVPAGPFGDLDRAPAVFCGGQGLGSQEGFLSFARYALGLGASVAATRKVVDLGWAPQSLQVGLTGRSVSPELYVSVAVSGAANHVVGVRRSRVIFSINSDPNAFIFRHCDVGLVADYREVLPSLADGLGAAVREASGGRGTPDTFKRLSGGEAEATG
ncbi:MAG: FAD-binding protein [Nitrososphaerota archaeon]|nr:FAD-binding protein [Nitrososphaerota archaeon]